MMKPLVRVDVIIPVHNSASTVEEAVRSSMNQVMHEGAPNLDFEIFISVCAYDDGSTDKSWNILTNLQKEYENEPRSSEREDSAIPIHSRLLLGKSPGGVGRGAGYARNRAVELGEKHTTESDHQKVLAHFLCLLDSDDIMVPTRVCEQTTAMMAMTKEERERTLLGCKVIRDPPESTWHYTQWANSLTDERLVLEKFRECTLLQPTWFLLLSRFKFLGGYIEADTSNEIQLEKRGQKNVPLSPILRLIHPKFDTPNSLRLAEDLRFFHAHLLSHGLLRLHRPVKDPDMPLVIYRHCNQSQSFRTSRKLLLHLRALAFEKTVLQPPNNSATEELWPKDRHDGKFVVWGAGRDGKDFVKALSANSRKRVYCFVDVDAKKIEQGYYANQELNLKIPIVHFSLLAKTDEQRKKLVEASFFSKIDKSKPNEKKQLEGQPKSKRQKTNSPITPTVSKTVARNGIDLEILPELPLVVCVAMYRTNGALEANVLATGRTEGLDLWHFS